MAKSAASKPTSKPKTASKSKTTTARKTGVKTKTSAKTKAATKTKASTKPKVVAKPKAATKPKITYADLIKRMQHGEVETSELRQIFKVNPNERAFGPTVSINRRLVDVTGVEKAADISAGPLLEHAEAMLEPMVLEGVQPSGFLTVAEGDSWFRLPRIYQRTLIDQLKAQGRVIDNIAKHGDELHEMIKAGEHIEMVKNKSVRVLLFSGGGNDVLGGGDLRRFLKLFNPSHKDPKKIGYYIKPSFNRMLGEVIDQISGVCRDVRNVNAKCDIFIHGYDYAIPRVNGPWLGKPFKQRGFDQAVKNRRLLAQAIVREMINRYNIRLAKLASQTRNLKYVDLRGLVGEQKKWRDELHPKSASARVLARKFDHELTRAGYTPAVF